ncbi:MAG: SurA N-terminal domain-containing protein [Candidatus Gorgyraea atricola]|nr:SurA N-terminal domain-containing protein [Candidatus Gorgyraea atricola]
MKMIFSVLLVSCFILSGCSCPVSGGGKKTVAQAGKYKMSVEDLKYELKSVPHDETALLDTAAGRAQYIDRLLEKELLLQEAQRQGLDREGDFMKSIESYWEQALLRLLLEKKSKEISGLIHVYDNEVEEHYRDSGEDLPLPTVRADIRRAIRQGKETEAMRAWIKELRKKSYIKINKKLLEEVLSNR